MATAQDAELLWRWANDPSVRANSFDSRPIPYDAHVTWLERRLTDPSARIWILEEDGQPAGQVRYERDGEVATVGISIDVEHRGHGDAKDLLERTAPLACSELNVSVLVALILINNVASKRAFERAGFVRTREEDHGGRMATRLERPCRPVAP